MRGALGSTDHRLARGAWTGLGDDRAARRRRERSTPCDAAGHRRGPEAALVVPGGTDGTAARLRERVVPALEALLAAALEREALQAEAVETQALRRATSEDGAAALGLARPAHAADRDRRRRRRRSARRAELARSAPSSARRSVEEAGGSRGWSTSCSTSRGWRPARPSRGASGLDRGDGSGRGRAGGGTAIASPLVDRPRAAAGATPTPRSSSGRSRTCSRTRRGYSGGHAVSVRAGRRRVTARDPGRRPRPGHPAGELERIFEPFYRGPRAAAATPARASAWRSPRASSRPTAARSAAESLPGQGTTFVVELPLVAQPDAEALTVSDSGA